MSPGWRCARPIVSWLATVLVMAPLAVLGLRSSFVQDVMTEMPRNMTSVKNLRWLATKFDAGALAPLTVVLDSDSDLRGSEGLALIDDVSRFLARQQRILEVRSATQPLGSTAMLDPARLSERLRAVNAGHLRMEAGSRQLQLGLNRGRGQTSCCPLARGADRDTDDRIIRHNPRDIRFQCQAGVGKPHGRTKFFAQNGETAQSERPAQPCCFAI